jgi:Protein of unknown function (DUF2852)
MTQTYSATADAAPEFGSGTKGRCGGSMKKRWSVLEVGAVVGGFAVYWPLGLLALGLKFIKGEVWPGASQFASPWKGEHQSGWTKPEGFGFKGNWSAPHSSGNRAFDDYRKVQLDRLEDERRKLDEDRKAFTDYLERLRMAKDKDEFDRFMSERGTS